MKYTFAPMEGITGRLFRRVHHSLFPGCDGYYTPFLVPSSSHQFAPRDFREILAGQDDGVPTVPQLLTKSAGDFLWAAGELRAMGCSEVNLNVGCPSGTVFSKGKGAGLLRDLEALDRLLDGIFAAAPLPVSVKTRLGVEDPDEFYSILEIYRKYPISELIIHLRTRSEQYKGAVHPESFAAAGQALRIPLCYNGDVRTVSDCRAVEERFPGASGIMIGRGMIADPALIRAAKGGGALTLGELQNFLDMLYAAYCSEFGAHNAMMRMKELWPCLRNTLCGDESIIGRIARAKEPSAYEFWARTAFREMTLR